MFFFKEKIYLTGIYIIFSLFVYKPLFAATIESLVMPGPVIEGHKKYEKSCEKCHSVFSRGKQDDLCKECHEDVLKDIDKKNGYHGKLKTITKCKNCHTEHKGRSADIVKFNQSLFDHKQSDFMLKGRHVAVACENCHKKEKKFREATSKCSVCHKENNPHNTKKLIYRNKLIQCKACHAMDGWTNIIFKHDKTDFKLDGKHVPVKCANCHPNDRYQKTPGNCYACHQYDDVHKRNKGKKCQKCHNSEGWWSLKFNHDKETRFSLKGRHQELQCKACHKEDPYRVKIKKLCYSCHKIDDRHNMLFGQKCDKCHAPKDWKKVSFRHNTDTKYKLTGRHNHLSCDDCHIHDAYKYKTSQKCFDCHKNDDVHEKQLSELCGHCHNVFGWHSKVTFDHDITQFPLIGLHSSLSCEECHLKMTYKDVETKCYSCHRSNDEHKGRLGHQCQICHNPNGWRVWDYDHDKKTEFKLDGKHKKLHCYDCHKNSVDSVKNKLSECSDCHSADDIHNGQFGRDCTRCHTTETFKKTNLLN